MTVSLRCGCAFFLEKLAIIKCRLSLPESVARHTGNAAQMETGAFIYVVFIIGVLAFSIAPVMRTRTIHSTIKMIVFLGLFFLTASGLMLSSARGGMDITYMIVVWFFCIFSTYLAGQIIMKLYFWMKKNESNEIDMVKMTFVWTILAYVLGKLV